MSYTEYTVEVHNDGDRFWFLNEQRHREDGPALEYSTGSKHWYINGERHREDGPALEYADGAKSWYINGQLHREDGPAAVSANGDKYWYIRGKQYTKEEFNQMMNPVPSCNNKEVEIDGKTYILKEKE